MKESIDKLYKDIVELVEKLKPSDFIRFKPVSSNQSSDTFRYIFMFYDFVVVLGDNVNNVNEYVITIGDVRLTSNNTKFYHSIHTYFSEQSKEIKYKAMVDVKNRLIGYFKE